jgi:hypothetical protein
MFPKGRQGYTIRAMRPFTEVHNAALYPAIQSLTNSHIGNVRRFENNVRSIRARESCQHCNIQRAYAILKNFTRTSLTDWAGLAYEDSRTSRQGPPAMRPEYDDYPPAQGGRGIPGYGPQGGYPNDQPPFYDPRYGPPQPRDPRDVRGQGRGMVQDPSPYQYDTAGGLSGRPMPQGGQAYNPYPGQEPRFAPAPYSGPAYDRGYPVTSGPPPMSMAPGYGADPSYAYDPRGMPQQPLAGGPGYDPRGLQGSPYGPPGQEMYGTSRPPASDPYRGSSRR